jgi:hypothetical protein
VRGKVRLLLVEVHRDQLELHRRLLLQLQQDVEHRVAVLAAGQAHHHLVAVLDHAEVGDRAPTGDAGAWRAC